MKSAGLFKYVSFLLPPGIKGLISCNSFRNVNMCLLEVAMCEKCKSCHFQLDGVSKNFEDWGVGLKSFRTGWANNLGGVLLLGGQYRITWHGYHNLNIKTCPESHFLWGVALVQIQQFGTASRYGLEILHQRGKTVKTKSQKVLGANCYVCRG